MLHEHGGHQRSDLFWIGPLELRSRQHFVEVQRRLLDLLFRQPLESELEAAQKIEEVAGLPDVGLEVQRAVLRDLWRSACSLEVTSGSPSSACLASGR